MTPELKHAVERLRSAIDDNRIPPPFNVHIRLILDAINTAKTAHTLADKPVPVTMQHVAYYDEGQFHWTSGIAPRECELYAAWPSADKPAPAADTGKAVAVWIERAALAELQKYKDASTSVCSGLLKKPFGDNVPLYTHPAPSDAERVRKAAERVCWFDWSDNDDDAVAAVEELRAALRQQEAGE